MGVKIRSQRDQLPEGVSLVPTLETRPEVHGVRLSSNQSLETPVNGGHSALPPAWSAQDPCLPASSSVCCTPRCGCGVPSSSPSNAVSYPSSLSPSSPSFSSSSSTSPLPLPLPSFLFPLLHLLFLPLLPFPHLFKNLDRSQRSSPEFVCGTRPGCFPIKSKCACV